MIVAGPAATGLARPQLIVVGVDGFTTAPATVQYAIELAAERSGRLVAVTAFRAPDESTSQSAVAVEHAYDAASARIRLVMSQVRVPPRVPVEEVVAEGDPAEVLAAVGAADILVIGRHHAEFLPQLFAAPVASAVVAGAVQPVIVVPPDWDCRPCANSPIVVALDGETAADAVLCFAFTEAEYQKAPVWAMHTVPAGLDGPGFDAERVNVAEILAGQRQDHPEVAVRMRLAPGDSAEQIVRLSTAAGLVVVGEPHRFRAGSWARSVARNVLDRTNCPLAIVPAMDAGRGSRAVAARLG